MTQASSRPVTRALLSVSDKTGILDLARFLISKNVEILSTGGTAKLLEDNNVPVTEVSSHTGFPEMMDGRVKTLHPIIHGGILGRRGIDDEIMAEHHIAPIDLVIVNLYPFAATVANPDCTLEDAIENIDIGGPTMVRATAKNHAHVTIVVDPLDYLRIEAEINMDEGRISQKTRFDLAVKAFEHTAHYDGMIANYLGKIVDAAPSDSKEESFPRTFNTQFKKAQSLRYGENPHQNAAFYTETPLAGDANISTATQLQGKELSYNNIADTDAALECVKQFGKNPACVIVKHANPCGVASSDSLLKAYDLAYKTDPESAFGGIIAFNQMLDEATASAIVERQFVEVIIAPAVSNEARKVISAKKNLRLLSCGSFGEPKIQLDFKRVTGGLLVQHSDLALSNKLQCVTEKQTSDEEMRNLLFAWKVAKFVKSNAIVYAKNSMTIGVGAGQMSRVNSARIASIKAKHAGLEVTGSVMASDAFFPFRDGIDAAAEAGISAIIQPGGSMRDEEVINAANEHGISMIFTGMRHFRH